MSSAGFVVDASIAPKWFIRDREEGVEQAVRLIGAVPMKTTSLALFEIGARMARGRGSNPHIVSRSLEHVRLICGEPAELEPDDYMLCASLAIEHGITFYDASYVAIARRLGRKVISADRDLLGPRLAVEMAAALDRG